MEIAAAGPDCSAAAEEVAGRPVKAAAMENRDFDYDALVRPMESRMIRSIWRIVRQREAAQDAFQEALTRIWKKRDTVARHPNPEALMLRISVAAAYDAVRRSRRRLRHEIPGLPYEGADSESPPITQGLEDRSLRAAVLEAVSGLPRKQATAVLLRVIEERPYEEIAGEMGCSEATVRVHVMRARAALAKRLARFRPTIAAGLEPDGREGIS